MRWHYTVRDGYYRNTGKFIHRTCKELQIPRTLYRKFSIVIWNYIRTKLRQCKHFGPPRRGTSRWTYDSVSKSFRTVRLARELQMVQLSATRCSCIAIFVSQSSEFCHHEPTCCFSTSDAKCKCIFLYRLSPETFDTASYLDWQWHEPPGLLF
jgi:hypothetical protein